jgi:hypothetical protein
MHIKRQIPRYPILIVPVILLAILIIHGCKGKEETPSTKVPAVTEQQGQTTGTQGVPSIEKPGVPLQEAARNKPPLITKFNIEPKYPVIGDTVRAEVETVDRDEDAVTVAYQWVKNDVLLEETSNTLLLAGGYKRGDKLSVKATPDDGKVKGTTLTVVVTIANASPVVKGVPEPFKLNGDLYTYQVKATDPDGDGLTYALKEAPDGMTIDPKKGFIQWKVPPDVTGTSSHTVSVTDGQGGETTATITLDIQKHSR